jgi:hypothetical protein
MAELIQEYATPVIDRGGTTYIARAYGQERSDGTWEGWLEFHRADGKGGSVLRTGQETSQPNRSSVEYWASGLEPVYFEGAFSRALGSGPH